MLDCLRKMNVAQCTACQPGIYVKNISQLHQHDSKPCVLPMSSNPCSRIAMSLRGDKPSFGLKYQPISKSQKPLRICLAGGRGMAENNDESSPWKAIEKAIEKARENFKGQSIEDVLQKQIQKGEYDSGGSGAKPPGGGGGVGGPDGTGGSEYESFAGMLEENLQVILATLGFIFLYIYILTGEELTKLARDYIKYLFGGTQSVRLKSAMVRWGLFYQSLTEKKEVDEYWLEKAILNTPTWWYDPEDFHEAVRNCYGIESPVRNNYDESDSDSDSDD